MFVFVNRSAAVEVNDIPVSIVEGDAWEAGDPVVKAYPSLFSDAPAIVKHSAPEKVAPKKSAAKES